MLTDNDKTILEKNNYMYINFYRPTDPKIIDGKLVCDVSHEVKVASYLDCWIGINDWTFDMAAFGADDIVLEPGEQVKRDSENGDYLKKYLSEFFFDKNKEYDSKDYEDLRIPWCVSVRLKNRKDTIHYLHLRINLHNRTVSDWPKGVKASFHYKSSDRNYFQLFNENLHLLYETRMNPEARGILPTQYMIGPEGWFQYSGDYFELKVDEQGNIINWNEQEMKESLEYWVNGMTIGNRFLVMNE